MRIGLISDIHNEFLRAEGLPVPDAYTDMKLDVLVLAGDIDIQEHGAIYSVRQSERLGVPVIYVLGNHEFYSSTRTVLTTDKVRDVIAGTNVHLLDAESMEINGVKFIGATLWTDYCLFGSDRQKAAMQIAQYRINDYFEIRMSLRPTFPRATSEDLLGWFDYSRGFIERELQRPFPGKRVVVTHHAPSLRCLPEDKQRDVVSACYASHLDELIEKYQPNAWLYGHIHGQDQIKIGNTQVQRHARGYPHLLGSPVDGYRPHILVV